MPKQLTDLFAVFDRLDAGQSVVLDPIDEASIIRPPAPEGVCLGVLSSGSTGLPKVAWRLWSELLAAVRSNKVVWAWTWASSYCPTSFAGVQVALQVWRTKGTLLALSKDWGENWRVLRDAQPQALSCTPTFLDILLQFERESVWAPKQITLGGEVLRPAAGGRFRCRFPNTRFTVIYAAAEHGILLKTHRLDGWYESARLGKRGRTWRVQEGVLELRRGDEWVSTGDRVEVSGALIRIVGRANAVANIGGVKVSLDDVTNFAEQVPGVRRAIAHAIRSPVVGQVVALRFEVEPNRECKAVQDSLELHLRKHLRKEAWPRFWEVGPVDIGPNSKRLLPLMPSRQLDGKNE